MGVKSGPAELYPVLTKGFIQIHSYCTYKVRKCVIVLVNPSSLPKFNCNNGSECGALTGFYSCKNGHCDGMSKMHECTYKADGLVIDSERDNAKLNGYFLCKKARCTKARNVQCVRICPRIETLHATVMARSGDSVRAAHCERAIALYPNGTLHHEPFWDANGGDVLFVSCTHLQPDGTSFRGGDCINGTLVNADEVPQPTMNFSVLWKLANGPRPADPDQLVAPAQENITIFNRSRLFINLEACVNTLQGECRAFADSHGQDGRNSTAPSRFPCYYDKDNNSFFVVARFDRQRTQRELVIGVTVPGSLFLMSLVTLCVMTRSVRVGDDARMRCVCCNDGADEPRPTL
ncbi:uncharacterized protein LOC124722205 [Schistocerca piceifrons]|uniref:uncharacterized protein LOC124722205 n=1 Tax=Schistocerca piceifrons TaxID=274613 RepID=UPI001F5EF9CA|nr:uncharacterized protein LOC124722205 [Schistocerca piceifrons]